MALRLARRMHPLERSVSQPGGEMCTVAELLDQKGHAVETVDANATIYDAIKKMSDLDIGALVVTEGERVVGTITERDYSRNVFLKGKSSPTTPVRDAMNKTPLAVDRSETSRGCMAIMTRERTRHLVVMESGELLGILSIGDLVYSIVAEQMLTIQELEQYIMRR